MGSLVEERLELSGILPSDTAQEIVARSAGRGSVFQSVGPAGLSVMVSASFPCVRFYSDQRAGPPSYASPASR